VWKRNRFSAGRVGAKRRIEAKQVACGTARLISIRYATQSALASSHLDTPLTKVSGREGPLRGRNSQCPGLITHVLLDALDSRWRCAKLQRLAQNVYHTLVRPGQHSVLFSRLTAAVVRPTVIMLAAPQPA